MDAMRTLLCQAIYESKEFENLIEVRVREHYRVPFQLDAFWIESNRGNW